MAAESVGPLYPAAFYLSHLRDLPTSFVHAAAQLKSEMTAHRLLRLSLHSLTSRLMLAESTLHQLEFFSQSRSIFLQCSELCESCGMKIAPFMPPLALQGNQTLILTLKPNLNNDEDISYVQSVLQSRRQVSNHDMPFISRMQLKLAQYNIMLRVIEGLGALSCHNINALQLEYLNNVLTSQPLPQEGLAYLKACLSFFSDQPCYIVDYHHTEHCLKPLPSSKHQEQIAWHLAQLGARSDHVISFDPRYPLNELCVMFYSRITHHKPRKLKAAEQSNLSLKQQIETMQQLAVEKARSSRVLAPEDISRFISELNCELERSQLFSTDKRENLIQLLLNDPLALSLMPPYAELDFKLPSPLIPDDAAPELLLCTHDPQIKELYPCFAYINPHHGQRLLFDAALDAQFFKLSQFTHSADLGSECALLAAQLLLHRLLLRPLFVGNDSTTRALFIKLCALDLKGELHMDPCAAAIAALYYLIYRQQLPYELQHDLPNLVTRGLRTDTALLCAFVWQQLRRTNMQLHKLQPQELNMVTLYCMLSFGLEQSGDRISPEDLADDKFVTKLLAFAVPQLLSVEKHATGPIFIRWDITEDGREQTSNKKLGFYKIAQSKLKLSILRYANPFEQLLTSALLCNLAKPVVLLRHPALQLLSTKCDEVITIQRYLTDYASQLPAQLQQLLNTDEDYAPMLRSYFPQEQYSINGYDLNQTFAIRFPIGSHKWRILLNFLLHKARLISIPQHPDGSAPDSGSLTNKFFFLNDDFNPPLTQQLWWEELQAAVFALIMFNYCSYISEFDPACELLLSTIHTDTPESKDFAERYLKQLCRLLVTPDFSSATQQNLLNMYKTAEHLQTSAKQLLLYLIANITIRGSARLRMHRFERLAEQLNIAADDVQQIKKVQYFYQVMQRNRDAAQLKHGSEYSTDARHAGHNAKLNAAVNNAAAYFDHLDQKIISSKLQESSEVLSVIGQLRAANESAELESHVSADAVPTAPTSVTAATTESNEALPMLPPEARELLHSVNMHAQDIMDLAEFTGMCLSCRFMSCDVAVEMLNDHAYEQFDEPVFDVAPEENAIYINLGILQKMLNLSA